MNQLFDMLKNPINLGDWATFTHGFTSKLMYGQVVKISLKMVTIREKNATEWKKHPELIIIIK